MNQDFPPFCRVRSGCVAGDWSRRERISVLSGRVLVAMTGQEALPVKDTQILESQSPRVGIRLDDGNVEVDQMAVVQRRPLRRADPVWIVTGRARNSLGQMLIVHWEALVAQDAIPTMALITEFIGRTVLLGKI